MNIPPQKPWEYGDGKINTNSRSALNMNSVPMNSVPPQSSSFVQNFPTRPLNSSLPNPVGIIRSTGPPPPLPPRPSNFQYPVQPHSSYYPLPYSGYGGYGTYGNSYGYGGIGGYGLSGLGGYGFGRPMPPLNDYESRFIQLAEESSRPAFQSIESLVRAFSSVSMMLESTFNAMYSSFRAVIGVAENFSRLRQLFAQFFSAIAVLQFAKNFLRRLLYWFGVNPNDPSKERIWQNAQSGQNSAVVSSSRGAWPIFAFLGLLFGGPYLMSKILGQPITEKTWDPQEEPGVSVVAIHSFQAGSNSELSFKRGQIIQLAPMPNYNSGTPNGWLLAADHQNRVGFIPSNRIARLPVTSTDTSYHSQQTVNTSAPLRLPSASTGTCYHSQQAVNTSAPVRLPVTSTGTCYHNQQAANTSAPVRLPAASTDSCYQSQPTVNTSAPLKLPVTSSDISYNSQQTTLVPLQNEIRLPSETQRKHTPAGPVTENNTTQ